MIHFLTLLLGFVPLIWGAHMLVQGATALSQHYKWPTMVVGLTIVAFGTSSPELAVTVFAAFNHDNFIALGTVTGSNIFNVAAVLGVAAIIYPLGIKPNTTWKEVPVCLLAGVVALIAANDPFFDKSMSPEISRADGLYMLLFFVVFIAFNIALIKNHKPLYPETRTYDYSKAKSWMYVLMGLAMLIAGGRLIVYAAENLADYLGITERIIALVIISAGTSLPELTTSIVAAKKKNTDLAVGTIVGSNIFNIFFILGLSALIHPMEIGQSMNEDLIFNLFISLLLFIFIFTGKGRMVDRVEGSIFVLLYVFYVCYILFIM